MAKVTGAHAIIYSRNAEADRGFLREVLDFPFVDVGHGWLIFGLPPAEVAVHPADEDEGHELYLMVDDVKGFMAAMAARGVTCTPARDLRWGVLTQVSLPSGATLGVYEPRHARPATHRKRASPRQRAVRKKNPAKTAGRRTES